MAESSVFLTNQPEKQDILFYITLHIILQEYQISTEIRWKKYLLKINNKWLHYVTKCLLLLSPRQKVIFPITYV